VIENQQQVDVKQVLDLVVMKVNLYHVQLQKLVIDMVESNLQLLIHPMVKMVQVNQVLKNFYPELFVFVG
jgi:hypothetical protein